MRLVVLAKRSLKSHVRTVAAALAKQASFSSHQTTTSPHTAPSPQIRDVACGREATGALHVMGNKGGIATKLTVLNTQLCFISCHLAAHLPKLSRRNQDVNMYYAGCLVTLLTLSFHGNFCMFTALGARGAGGHSTGQPGP